MQRLLLPTFLVAVMSAVPVSAQSTALIAGCIADAAHQRVPHVTVTLSAQSVRRTTLANDQGCYEFDGLSPGTYRVTARLLGFNNVTRDKINLSHWEARRVDFTMAVSAICECLAQPNTLQGLFERARAVVHLRITDHESELSAPPGFFKQTAQVLEVFKRHPDGGPTGTTITVLQDQSSGAPEPYSAGDEFVMFLAWWHGEDTFIEGQFQENVALFSFEAGRVVRSPASVAQYNGVPAARVLVDLQKLSSASGLR